MWSAAGKSLSSKTASEYFKQGWDIALKGDTSSLAGKVSLAKRPDSTSTAFACKSDVLYFALLIICPSVCSAERGASHVDLAFPLSVLWDFPENRAEIISIASFRLAFSVCIYSNCVSGALVPYKEHSFLLQMSGLELWNDITCDIVNVPWPQGTWLLLRKNDDLHEIIFLPWCFPQVKGYIFNATIELPKTVEIWLQLFLGDENRELRGIVSSEKLVKIVSQSCVDQRSDYIEEQPMRTDTEHINSSAMRLSRTQMCNLLDEYPLIWNNSRRPHPAADGAGQQQPDTLILYAFSQSAGWREDNLFFLLALGLPPRGRYHLVVIVNGPLDPSWARLLDHVARLARGAFEWVRRRDCGRDICAWLSLLGGVLPLRHPLARFRRFLLMNGSVRGPFVPAGFRAPWPELFLSLLGDGVGLAGATVSCAFPGYSPDDAETLHVQSYLLAFASGPVLEAAAALMRTACATAKPDISAHELAGKIEVFERRLTRDVLDLGLNVAVTQHLWRVRVRVCVRVHASVCV
jgi:hypothetical protein